LNASDSAACSFPLASCAACSIAGAAYRCSCAARNSRASRDASICGVSVQSAICAAVRSTNVLPLNAVVLPVGAPAFVKRHKLK